MDRTLTIPSIGTLPQADSSRSLNTNDFARTHSPVPRDLMARGIVHPGTPVQGMCECKGRSSGPETPSRPPPQDGPNDPDRVRFSPSLTAPGRRLRCLLALGLPLRDGCRCSSVVERTLGKGEVVGSNPTSGLCSCSSRSVPCPGSGGTSPRSSVGFKDVVREGSVFGG